MKASDKQKRVIYVSAVLTFVTIGLFGFQNCAETTFTEADVAEKSTLDGSETTQEVAPTPPTAPPTDNPVPPEDRGISEVEDPVTCVTGKKLGIWLDPLDLGTRYPANYLGDIVAYQGSKTAERNYDYYSASAHPEVGPDPVPFQASVFFYEGSDGLSLNFFANVDEGGSSLSKYVWDIKTTGNNMKDYVIVSDDPEHRHALNKDGAELEKYKTVQASKTQYYKGEFEHYKNTDGGVIGPFEGEDFLIRVLVKSSDEEPKFPVDIEKAKFHSANGGSFSLSTDVEVFSSFIIGFQEYETCEDQ